ncbi:MAG: hypothetical protein J6S43_01920 [Lentisphaeria bacterium]|nr:hypothetical protein [Lentisphaeria bacterium]
MSQWNAPAAIAGAFFNIKSWSGGLFRWGGAQQKFPGTFEITLLYFLTNQEQCDILFPIKNASVLSGMGVITNQGEKNGKNNCFSG